MEFEYLAFAIVSTTSGFKHSRKANLPHGLSELVERTHLGKGRCGALYPASSHFGMRY